MKPKFKTPAELINIAAREKILLPVGGVAHSLHLPKKIDGPVQVVSFYYQLFSRLNAPAPGKITIEIYPPYKLLTQDALTGDVIGFINCTPEDLGISQPADESIHTAVDDFKQNPDSLYWKQNDRFKAISPLIWEIYEKGKSDHAPDDKKLLHEYRDLFFVVAQEPLIPYYKALSPNFFRWLEDASR